MKRIPVKWIRDRAKSAYVKEDHCYICHTTKTLELHHLYSITQLFDLWCANNSLSIETDEQILAIRDNFIAEHHKEIYKDVFTLCKSHHGQLHSIYGIAPQLTSADAQRQWIHIQRIKPPPLNFNSFII